MHANKMLIVDDHPMFLEALRGAVSYGFPGAEMLEASSIDRALEALEQNNDVDLALLDLAMPDVSGFGGLVSMRSRFPAVPVLIVSGLDDPRIVAEAMRHGAIGFVPKSSPRETIAEAMRIVLEGDVFLPESLRDAVENVDAAERDAADLADRIASLTPQQFRVLQMLAEGMLNKQIAYELSIGETTVKAHVSAILRKLKVYSRTQAVIQVSKLDFKTILHGGEAGAKEVEKV